MSVPAGQPWRCPSCGHQVPVQEPAATTSPDGLTLSACGVCGNHELYKMKGFPHWLGLTVLTAACLAFLVLMYYRQQWWAWAVLLGSAAADGLLYLAVRDVVVCYRCGARHAGIGRAGNAPFELTVHERYRQERIRLEEERKTSPPV
jgi:hypothetical protein